MHPQAADEIQIAFNGQLHNQADLRRHLGLADTNLNSLLRVGWQRWGEGLAEKLIGDYALAIRDSSRQLSYLARDPLGVKPLYYRVDRDHLSHGFSIPQLRQRCPLSATQDLDWAAAYMLSLSFSQTDTAYKEIKKVAPGHWLSCDASGRIKSQCYHHWRDDAPFTTQRDPRWVDAYREVLEEAIRCRMDSDAPMGTENSGGIDSATITAYLAHFLGDPGDRLHSFAFALCEQEPSFILETSQAKRIRHNYVDTAWAPVEDMIPSGLAALGHPPEHSNSTGHIAFYRECRVRGIHSLFSGFGGDEVVTNHGYLLRRELLDRQQYSTLWGILPGNPLRRTLRLLKAIALKQRHSDRNPDFLSALNQRWPHLLLRPEVAQRLNLYERYRETAAYDAPYRSINEFIIGHHLTRMQLSARLENCTIIAAAYGVDYRWPLWDQRLVQQYLSTPSIEKVGPQGMGRYLHRRAIDGVVPRRVTWKPSKDMGYGVQRAKPREAALRQITTWAGEMEAKLHPALETVIDRTKLRQQIQQLESGKVIESNIPIMQNLNHLHWLNQWFSLEDGS